MSFGIPEILSLIGLVAGLTSTGVGAGKSGARGREEELVRLREADIERAQKKREKQEQQEARKAAIARAIGASVRPMADEPSPMPEPYKPEDLSAYDVAGGVAQAVGSTAQQAGQIASNISPSIESGADVTGKLQPDTYTGGEIDINAPAVSGGLAKASKYDPDTYYRRYGRA